MNAAARARVLPLAICALALLAVLKFANIWVGFSAADAEETVPIPADGAPEEAVTAQAEPAVKQASALPENPTEVERRILEKLAARRESLDARERQIETREALLEAAETRLGDRLAQFQSERAELEAMRTEQREGESEEVGALVSAYEKMKSKDAARIFDALDEDILVPVASGMRTQALSGVLAEMKPENARKLTRALAERNKVAAASAAPIRP